MSQLQSQKAVAKPNVSFSDFYRYILSIYNAMEKTRQGSFRKTVGKYFKEAAEPAKGWSFMISPILMGSEVSVTWSDSSLDDLKRGKAAVVRTIACYYYLHSLTDDLSFANAVDDVVFWAASPGERTFAKTNGGKPVFQSAEKTAEPEDISWKSALNKWSLERRENRPANGLFGQLSIERTQGGDTREPMALLAEVHIRPAYEHESGIELQFKSVDILLECAVGLPSEIVYSQFCDEPGSDEGHSFRLQGTRSGPYVTLSNDQAGLDGTYISGTVATFHPNCRDSELSAALLVRILTTNAIFPEDIPSIMKRQIIKRIAEKATLSAPDKHGHILLHTLRYGVSAVER